MKMSLPNTLQKDTPESRVEEKANLSSFLFQVMPNLFVLRVSPLVAGANVHVERHRLLVGRHLLLASCYYWLLWC
jgi:hypothetical protein